MPIWCKIRLLSKLKANTNVKRERRFLICALFLIANGHSTDTFIAVARCRDIGRNRDVSRNVSAVQILRLPGIESADETLSLSLPVDAAKILRFSPWFPVGPTQKIY